MKFVVVYAEQLCSRAVSIHGDVSVDTTSLLDVAEARPVHLDAVVSNGCCGMLAMHEYPASDSIVRSEYEFIQLLGLIDNVPISSYSRNQPGSSQSAAAGALLKRYPGMKASIFSSDQSIISLSQLLGFSSTETIDSLSSSSSSSSVSNGQLLAEKCLSALSSSDLSILHLSCSQETRASVLSVIDSAISVLTAAQQSQQIQDLYLIVVGSYASSSASASTPISPSSPIASLDATALSLLPKQSFSISLSKDVPNIRNEMPMLAAYYCPEITRRDSCSIFSEREIATKAGNRCILVDHFLSEVAFKLGLLPKYGA